MILYRPPQSLTETKQSFTLMKWAPERIVEYCARRSHAHFKPVADRSELSGPQRISFTLSPSAPTASLAIGTSDRRRRSLTGKPALCRSRSVANPRCNRNSLVAKLAQGAPGVGCVVRRRGKGARSATIVSQLYDPPRPKTPPARHLAQAEFQYNPPRRLRRDLERLRHHAARHQRLCHRAIPRRGGRVPCRRPRGAAGAPACKFYL